MLLYRQGMIFETIEGVGRNLNCIKLMSLANMFGSALVILGELVRIHQITLELVMESAPVIPIMFLENPPIAWFVCWWNCKEVGQLAI